jgi:hypothetical protein
MGGDPGDSCLLRYQGELSYFPQLGIPMTPRIEVDWSQPPEPVDVPRHVPRDNLLVYSRIFQLESWLREMVYLELYAAFGSEWEAEYERRVGNKARRARGSRDRDKRLSHMRTKEERVLAYADIGDLFTVIYDDSQRRVDPIFAAFFPPGEVLGSKLQEILFIRLRTMHCRTLHRSDHDRLVQFLKDVDQGFWHWCTSYNGSRIPNLAAIEDVVGKRFLERDPRPMTRVPDGSVRTSAGGRVHDDPVGMRLEYSARPCAQTGEWRRSPLGQASWLYHVSLYGNPPSERRIDCQSFLQSTRALHQQCVYVHVADNSIEITLPRLAQPNETIELIEAFYDVARHCAVRWGGEPSLPLTFYEGLAARYPENVLGPENPLSFLSPDMPCSWFGVDVDVPPFNPSNLSII